MVLEYQNRKRTFDRGLRILQPGDDRILLVDQKGRQLGLADFAFMALAEMGAVVLQRGAQNLAAVGNLADGDDGVSPERTGHHQRLPLEVADAADSGLARQIVDLPVELRSELRIGDAVGAPGHIAGAIQHGHAAITGAEVRMIIRPVKQIADAIKLAGHTEKTAHRKRRPCYPPNDIESCAFRHPERPSRSSINIPLGFLICKREADFYRDFIRAKANPSQRPQSPRTRLRKIIRRRFSVRPAASRNSRCSTRAEKRGHCDNARTAPSGSPGRSERCKAAPRAAAPENGGTMQSAPEHRRCGGSIR
ncbi:hypothetical protein SDC9_115054 [bioreactor metagenome]|uniref:Uncharacterized protein n=1 Tax=bioreactor metagenome TaxID=1076179 RepID=A0A645BYC9_9ZZZZ